MRHGVQPPMPAEHLRIDVPQEAADIRPSSRDETNALTGTVPPDLTATPLSTIKRRPSVPEEERCRLRLAVLWTAGTMTGRVLLAGLAYLIFR